MTNRTWAIAALTLPLCWLTAGCSHPSTTPVAATTPSTPPAASTISSTPSMDKDGFELFDAYELRPPAGYTFKSKPGPNGATAYAWISPPHKDGKHGYIMAVVVSPPEDELEKHTSSDILSTYLKDDQRNFTGWKSTNLPAKTINGVSFTRAGWSGAEVDNKEKIHGTVYVAIDDPNLVQITAQDEDPFSTASLPVMEKAIETTKKP